MEPTGGHDTAGHCVCVTDHRPAPLELARHHIWPLAMGGPDTETNLVWLCPTTHANVHELLRELVRRGGLLTFGEAVAWSPRPVSRYAWWLAHEGWRRYREGTG